MPKAPFISLTHHEQERSTSCLPACVLTVLSHWKVVCTEPDLRRLLKSRPHSGTHAINLIHLSELGFTAWPTEGTLTELQHRVRTGTPVIAFLWTGELSHLEDLGEAHYLHTVVVVGWTEKTVWVHDPLLHEGPIEIPRGEFMEAWSYARQMMAVIQIQET